MRVTSLRPININKAHVLCCRVFAPRPPPPPSLRQDINCSPTWRAHSHGPKLAEKVKWPAGLRARSPLAARSQSRAHTRKLSAHFHEPNRAHIHLLNASEMDASLVVVGVGGVVVGVAAVLARKVEGRLRGGNTKERL